MIYAALAAAAFTVATDLSVSAALILAGVGLLASPALRRWRPW
ncbi:hypothetical protein [Parafrankia sp. FMc2]